MQVTISCPIGSRSNAGAAGLAKSPSIDAGRCRPRPGTRRGSRGRVRSPGGVARFRALGDVGGRVGLGGIGLPLELGEAVGVGGAASSRSPVAGVGQDPAEAVAAGHGRRHRHVPARVPARTWRRRRSAPACGSSATASTAASTTLAHERGESSKSVTSATSMSLRLSTSSRSASRTTCGPEICVEPVLAGGVVQGGPTPTRASGCGGLDLVGLLDGTVEGDLRRSCDSGRCALPTSGGVNGSPAWSKSKAVGSPSVT